jgi:phosphopantothenoylcysteine decarboxylase / phosphopantothenate---cysteine ligase
LHTDNIYNDYKNSDNINTFFHPSKDIKGTLGTELLDKKIVICVTASVACYRTIDLIRLLIRHGAEVRIVMSKSVEKFISKDYFTWASGNDVVSSLSGNLEHIILADYGKSDLIVVYPATANTIGKFANGIDDTPPTSILSVGLGSKIPIIIAPAMHQSMYENNIIIENIHKLEKENVIFVSPLIKEGKAKIADAETILKKTIEVLQKNISTSLNDDNDTDNDNDNCNQNIQFTKRDENVVYDIDTNDLKGFFLGKRILISYGGTIEYIDPIRVISNTSTGKMGISLVKNAVYYGSQVTIVKGLTNFNIENDGLYSDHIVKIHEVKTSNQMYDVILNELKSFSYDIVILAAAVSDFKPSTYSESKIPSDTLSLNIHLVPTIKIIDNIKDISKDLFLVAFKADYNTSVDSLLLKAYNKLLNSNADLVVANDVGKKGAHIGSELNEVFLIDKDRNYYHFPLQSKNEIANKILKIIYLGKMNLLQSSSR